MKSLETTQKIDGGARRGSLAFTLIELLVVIAIIGALAALVLPLSGIAAAKMRISRVKTELNALVNAIESYKLETGEYPPDHGLLHLMSSNDWRGYRERAALNPLFYELTGAVFTNRSFITVHENEELSVNDLDRVFRRRGIRNSARHKHDIDYKGFSPKEAQFAQLSKAQYSVEHIDILKVPVTGPFWIVGEDEPKIFPWFYDASSTNRHNKQSYDLWAEIIVQGKTNTIGNWK